MKRVLLETSYSYSNVFKGINSYFSNTPNLFKINCGSRINYKLIQTTMKWYKPKFFDWSMSLMPDFYTGFGKKNIMWIHDTLFFEEKFVFGYSNNAFKSQRSFLQKFASKANYIVTPSLYSKGKIQHFLQVDEKKILHLPYQIDNSGFSIIKTEANSILSKSSFKILFVGSAHYRKNLKQVLETFRVFSEKNKDSELIIVSQPRLNIPYTYENYQDLPSNVTLMDNISDQYLDNLIKECNVLLNPTLEEGFGLPNIECQMKGIPIISSNISCIPEIVGDSGILIDPLNTEEQVHALNSIMNDEELRVSLINKGYENIKKYNDINRYEILKTIIDNS